MSVEPVSGGSTLEAVYRREAPRLWRALMAFTAGRSALAEDAVAEAFSRALAQPERIRDPVAWLYRVAFRIAAAELRREGRSFEAREASVAQVLPADEDLGELFRALARVPPNQRAAIFLHYQCDLPVADVAARLGVSRATARVHLWRGRARLRSMLGGGEDE